MGVSLALAIVGLSLIAVTLYFAIVMREVSILRRPFAKLLSPRRSIKCTLFHDFGGFRRDFYVVEKPESGATIRTCGLLRMTSCRPM